MDVIPGRMALLVTLFLVLVNIFNNVTTNSPKAETLTAIEIWMLACILFVFGKQLQTEFFLLIAAANLLIQLLKLTINLKIQRRILSTTQKLLIIPLCILFFQAPSLCMLLF